MFVTAAKRSSWEYVDILYKEGNSSSYTPTKGMKEET
jgi:hypothetical protein